MKKVFIAYANDAMAYSLKRIGRQAKKLRIFDDILLYTPNDLPDYAKNCDLMQYSYGGGTGHGNLLSYGRPCKNTRKAQLSAI